MRQVVAALILGFSIGCATTGEDQAQWNAVANGFSQMGNHFSQQRQPASSPLGGQMSNCQGSMAPYAQVGCRNICINGQWSEVCD